MRRSTEVGRLSARPGGPRPSAAMLVIALVLGALLAACNSSTAIGGSSPGGGRPAVMSSAPPATSGPTTSGPAAPASATAPAPTTVAATPQSATLSDPAPSPPASSRTAPPTTGIPVSTSSTAPSPPARSCAARTLGAMSLAQRVGQLVMIGVPADDVSAWPSVLGSRAVGGVFLAGRSTAPAAALAADLADLQARAAPVAGAKLHVAVDQEGGYVQSLRGPDFPAIPSALEQGLESTATVRSGTTTWAAALVRAGITLDLAPVADVVPAGTADDNPPIGAQDRQYGATPDAVSGSIAVVVRAMRSVGLGTTVKHFPGLGRVRSNTDTSADAVDEQTTPDDPSLAPFRSAIAAGTTAVMVSSARYPQLDPDALAVFSRPVITGLLRGRLHFAGLVLSDDLGNAVAVQGVPVGQRAVQFVAAGGDMALTVRPADLPALLAGLTARAVASPAFRALVDLAAGRVLASKQALGLLGC